MTYGMGVDSRLAARYEMRMAFAVADPKAAAIVTNLTDVPYAPVPPLVYGLDVFPYLWRCARRWIARHTPEPESLELTVWGHVRRLLPRGRAREALDNRWSQRFDDRRERRRTEFWTGSR